MSFRSKVYTIAISLFAFIGLGLTIIGPASAQKATRSGRIGALSPSDTSAQALPFSQDWANAGLITTNDSWSGVLGITGYLGDWDTVSGTGADPRTLLTPFATNNIDVVANIADPNTQTSGGVYEFDTLANPTIGMQGSGTADAPHIVIFLNTTGKQSIRVRYNARDLDGNADNAIQQIATHYRVGGSGNWTNIAAGYIADATDGPSVATKVTAVDVTLPSDANNKALVEVRIMTTNAAGSDEFVGIDDIQITGDNYVAPVPVSISAGAVPGQTVTVPVTIGDVTGKAVSAYDFTLNYDSTKLTPASPAFDTAGTLSSGMTITPNTSTSGRVVISAFGTGNLSGSGTLINLKFTVNSAAVGTAALSWQSFVLNEGDPAAAATGGNVVVGRQIVDFNGDGKTDFSVIRPSGSNLIWYTALNGPGTVSGAQWGLSATDYPTPADFDGDGKSDIAVWREAPSNEAAYYILNSSNSTFRFELFGQTGDDPSVTGDYDGDGKADAAVFRCPQTTGQCYYFYRASNNNPSGNITFIPWGSGTPTTLVPVSGDFDGDAKLDFGVRNTNGTFFLLKSANLGFEAIQWGLGTDYAIPRADFDGDGLTDIAVGRIGATNYEIYTIERDGGGTGGSPILWGADSLNDEPAIGDYDGDGKTDITVWRPSNGVFYVLKSTGGFQGFQFGASGDIATAGWIFTSYGPVQ